MLLLQQHHVVVGVRKVPDCFSKEVTAICGQRIDVVRGGQTTKNMKT